MKTRAACLFACLAFVTSCEKKAAEVTVTETRPATTRDAAPRLSATSDERFRDAKPSPVTAPTPAGWLAQPATQMRLLNYRFGASGTGEVWVTLSQGSVLENANRWFKQFGAPELDAAGFAKLPAAELAGGKGVWVTAEGSYDAGMAAMGAGPKDGYALAGVIALVKGQILTVKMVGLKDEVVAAKPALETYVSSVRLAE